MAVDQQQQQQQYAAMPVALDLTVDADELVRAQSIRLKREKLAQMERVVAQVCRALFGFAMYCALMYRFQLNDENKRLRNELATTNARGQQLVRALVDALQQLESAGALGETWRDSETRRWFDETFGATTQQQ